MHCKGSRDCDTLLLAAGEVRGIGVLAAGHADAGEQLFGFCDCVLAASTRHFHGREDDVLEHTQMGEKVKMLVHHAHFPTDRVDVGAGGENVDAVDYNLAGVGLHEAVDAAKERALAAAAAADDDHGLALVDVKIYVFPDGVFTESFCEASDADHAASPPLQPGAAMRRMRRLTAKPMTKYTMAIVKRPTNASMVRLETISEARVRSTTAR